MPRSGTLTILGRSLESLSTGSVRGIGSSLKLIGTAGREATLLEIIGGGPFSVLAN